jgi:hypothetical protein
MYIGINSIHLYVDNKDSGLELYWKNPVTNWVTTPKNGFTDP